ncbi:hypothetical protein COZ40_03185 [Candidatus Roizmanbacteria bacterium CG_4_10_14_3_um_filter_39_13]|uniref:FAD-binding FR-type domain-containing protein n=1 Tax=Candidatus Roizmanbacteria bacterium CG_4_10_14_3_um_filter_39_13 TaxID=1974831 RepID=A0A2M7LK60_9BACT|nr:MAG: hypothetical protein COZ40_03185 [Candidatus Roizmanbacteria bacterium CG_4_10_14_3_um_filter_39_13]
MKKFVATLSSKQFVTNDVCYLLFSFDDPEFTYAPGQYIILSIPTSTTPLKRLYSFAGSNTTRGSFELLVKIVPGGAASEYIRILKMGDKVEVSGPAGLFTLQNNDKRKIYMVTGTGIAPIRSFLVSSAPRALNSILLWGLKDVGNSYLADELLSLKTTSPRFEYYYCFSQQSTFEGGSSLQAEHFKSGHIDSVWRAVVPVVLPEDEYYLCGSRTVIESLRVLLLSLGVERGNLFFEKY